MISRTIGPKANQAVNTGASARTSSQKTSSFIDLFRGKAAAQQPATAAASIASQQNSLKAIESAIRPLSVASASTTAVSDDNNAKDAAAAPADLATSFTPQGVEDHMNQWLVSVLRQQNDFETQKYNLAVEGWKNTNARNRELGLPETPPPPPPQLAEAAPMPAGWWLQSHS